MTHSRQIDGETRLFGVLGHPVRASLSPAMHNAAFAALGMNARYVPFPTLPEYLETAVRGLAKAGVAGFNLTVPHKQTILPLLDEITPQARAIGAVNTVRVTDGQLHGANTDGDGLLAAIDEALGFSCKGAQVLILGAGGAARGIAFALLDAGASQLVISNRTAERAMELAKECARHFPKVEVTGISMDQAATLTTGLVINATSVGMGDGHSPVRLDKMQISAGVVDIVYNPLDTPLLLQARALGLPTADGLGMLLHQGWLAFQFWTGVEPPLDVMRTALAKGLAQRER